jgi:hypothetical protein
MRTAMSVHDGKDTNACKSPPAGVAEKWWSRIIETLSNPDFLAVALFCVIGLLIALNLMFRFPAFGAIIEQYNQF